MHIRTSVFTLVAGLALAAGATSTHASAREEARLLISSEILEELRTVKDDAIPDRLLQRAYGIAVIPSTTKIAFFLGGRRGHGVLVVRDKDGRFTSPVFITMTGGSFGWQWGIQSTDIVLVFTTPKGVEGINGGKVTLGAGASVAAGPVGREASAATTATFNAEVYSYSRNRGVFAGLAVDGSVLSIDDGADASFYKKPGVASGDILSGSVTSDDESARRFMTAVATSTATHSSALAAAPPTAAVTAPAVGTPAAAAPAAATTHAAAPAPGATAQSFPLSDQHPGQEPK
ncbi:MAG TPA: lipid-binding SYLF domain-containing protein [Steroidobacteraceae bacterium]|jgi:lipid-binding SYLF domain-containing protein|nr:lipid-binding SYLF domain-containing protein [Steroidobacteraceae bacterium]